MTETYKVAQFHFIMSRLPAEIRFLPSPSFIPLIRGSNGWIAGLLKNLLESHNISAHTTTCRMEDGQAVCKVLDQVQPTHVFNCAGVTGRPNVDWCESNKEETVRSNAIGTLNLADCCAARGIHITVFATGCIYEYDDEHPIGGETFSETDPANS
jgi:3,5-epimerase/4-reductase